MLIVSGVCDDSFIFIRTVEYGDCRDSGLGGLLEGPAHRILMDDDDPRIPKQTHEVDEASSAKKTVDP